MSSFLSSLFILNTNPLSDVEMIKIFSHSVHYSFVLWMLSFTLQKLFSFTMTHLLIVDINACAIGVLFRKLSPVPKCSWLFPNLSSVRFTLSG